MSFQLVDNKEANRFEVEVEGYTAFVDYRRGKSHISYIHTGVPKELKGKGVGAFLAKNVLEYAKEHQLRVKPYCPFIKAYIDKHPEYQSISDFHKA